MKPFMHKGLGFILTLSLAIGLTGCAKKLGEIKSDTIKNDSYSISQFDKSIIVETHGETSEAFSTAEKAQVASLFAINEKNYYPIRYASGAPELAKFIIPGWLKVEAQGPGQKFEITFKLTDSNLVAYISDVSDKNFSKAVKSLSRVKDNKYPLFQIAVDGYGVLRRTKNDLGEETRTVEFKGTDKENASHVQVKPTNAKKLGGLIGLNEDTQATIYLSSRLEGRIWSLEQLASIANIKSLKLEKSSGIYWTVFDKSNLYIYEQYNLADLNAVEREKLENKDNKSEAVQYCPENIKKLFSSEREKANCVIKHIGLLNGKAGKFVNLEVTKDAANLDQTLAEVVIKDSTSNDIRTEFFKIELGGNFDLVGRNDAVLDVYPIALFKSSVMVKSYGESLRELTKNKKDTLKDLYAVNENDLYAIKYVSGSLDLEKFIIPGWLEFEAQKADDEIKVSFILTDNSLVGYVSDIGTDSDYSESVKAIALENNGKYPLFEIDLNSYGYLRKIKNSAGDETNKVEFVSSVRAKATHVKVRPINGKTKGGLKGIPTSNQSEILLADKLENKLWTLAELNMLADTDKIEKNPEEDIFWTVFYKNQLLVLQFSTEANLNNIEKNVYLASAEDKRAMKCPKELLEKHTQLDKADCYLKVVASLDENIARFVNLEVSKDRGNFNQPVAGLNIRPNVSATKGTKFFYIVEGARFSNAKTEDDGKKSKYLIKKSLFDQENDYLYVPSTMGTPREVKAAAPFYQGSEQIVRLRFTENALQVYKKDEDRFATNTHNESLILSLPVEHLDKNCQSFGNDKDGKKVCVEFDGHSTDRPWQKREFVRVKPMELRVEEVSGLDFFALDQNCLDKLDTVDAGTVVEDGVLNIELAKQYKINEKSNCLFDHFDWNTYQFKNTGFTVNYFYSLVRLNDIATEGYEAVNYPEEDHNEFGFFKNRNEKLNDVFDPSRKNISYQMNRWASGTAAAPKTVKYYLSETFNKPQNALLKAATYKAFKLINEGLDKANTGLKLSLEKPEIGRRSGDLRNSMIVLIDDPLANGLLGYGPSVANPRTGEIVQAHTNMYSGVLRTLTKRVYDQMKDLSIDLNNAKKAKARAEKEAQEQQQEDQEQEGQDQQQDEEQQPQTTPQPTAQPTPQAKVEDQDEDEEGKLLKFASVAKTHNDLYFLKQLKNAKSINFESSLDAISNQQLSVRLTKRSQRKISPEFLHKTQDMDDYEKRLIHISKQNGFPKEYFEASILGKDFIPGIKEIADIKNTDGTLKEWKDLTAEQKEKATDIIQPHVWVSVLIHELGHNLGLRHNFMGSADKENFYTLAEANAAGMDNRVPNYSSVMDYAFSELNELGAFGKYDLAALRFAYAREVVAKDETVHKVNNIGGLRDFKAANAAVELKSFMFCTDENAGLSAFCNRFDEGSSLVDITKHYIKRYETSYKYRNWRDGRNNFSVTDNYSYARRRNGDFQRIRNVFENWEFFSDIFGVELMTAGCSPQLLIQYPDLCKRITENIDSTKLAANFLMGIIKTPDHTCAIATKAEPTKTNQLIKLFDLYDRIKFDINYVPKDCFDPEIKKMLADSTKNRLEGEFVIKGEAGKYLRSIKDPDQRFPYKSDIRVRGTWIDKLIAMKFLTSRSTFITSYEDDQSSFMELQDLAGEAKDIISHLLTGTDLSNPVSFKKEDGSEFTEKYSLDLSEEIPAQPAWSPVRRMFGLEADTNEILNNQLLLIASVFNQNNSPKYKASSKSFQRFFSVHKKDLATGISNADLVTMNYEDKVLGASKSNDLAYQMISSINSLDFLMKQDPAAINAIFLKRVRPTVPVTYTDNEKLAFVLDMELLDQVLGIVSAGTVLDRAFLIGRFGPERGAQIWAAYELGATRLAEIIKDKQAAMNAPANATADVKKLYDLDLSILNDFVGGELNTKVERYMTTLEILPSI